ncbi:MAG: hypothetical protein AB7P76_04605 [Candidatus Melainabacteria bacterium]
MTTDEPTFDDQHPLDKYEIQMLISQYLDGQLDEAMGSWLAGLMQRYPEYMAMYARLLEARSAFQQFVKTIPIPADGQTDMWPEIARQMNTDLQATPLDPDPEFVSAYYDGEVASTDPQREVFERQLSQNAGANQLLADVGEISDALKNFGYRLENACSVDVAASVMAAFAADPTPYDETLDEDCELDEELMTLSAYLDGELAMTEAAVVKAQMAANPPLAETAADWRQIGNALRASGQQQADTAPDFWPAVANALATDEASVQAPPENEPQTNVVPFPGSRTAAGKRPGNATGKKTWLAVPLVAAISLIVLAFPQLQQITGNFLPLGASPASQEIASVPMGNLGAGDVVLMDNSQNAAAGEAMAYHADGEVSPGGGARDIPSSEAYLFNTLQEELSPSELQILLGP